MKNFLFIVFSTLCIFSPKNLMAIDLYAMGSYWEVEDAEGVWGAGAGISIPLLVDYLKLDARAYAFEDSNYNRDNLELIPVDLGVQIHMFPSATLNPYLLGGASYIAADTDRVDIDSDFGAYAGAGLNFALSENFKLFGEAVFRFAELSTDTISEEDVDLGGITANAGIKLSF